MPLLSGHRASTCALHLSVSMEINSEPLVEFAFWVVKRLIGSIKFYWCWFLLLDSKSVRYLDHRDLQHFRYPWVQPRAFRSLNAIDHSVSVSNHHNIAIQIRESSMPLMTIITPHHSHTTATSWTTVIVGHHNNTSLALSPLSMASN